ncbi:MAG: PIN domain-containing protein [Sulfuricellaceae bacterium]|nr:PIN domain-containing protein [Sulfuricellaceae bacterium]
MILVDSSVWIDLLRDVQTPQTLVLRDLLSRHKAALAQVIYQEILQGAASPERFDKLKRYFSTLPFLEASHPIQTWEAAAEIYMRCRQQGFTPRSPHDCLVARIALEHDALLLHDDKDFEVIAKVEPGLRLFVAV